MTKGAGTIYVRLLAGGEQLTVAAETAGLSVCVGEAQVGNIEFS